MNTQITKTIDKKILEVNELNDFFSKLPKLTKKDRENFLRDIRKIRLESNYIKNFKVNNK